MVLFFGFSPKYPGKGGLSSIAAKRPDTKPSALQVAFSRSREEQADINLYVYRGEEKEYHSMTAAAALVDALIVAISERLGADGAKTNLAAIHRMKKKYRI